jgi:hypothetical protein
MDLWHYRTYVAVAVAERHQNLMGRLALAVCTTSAVLASHFQRRPRDTIEVRARQSRRLMPSRKVRTPKGMGGE